MQFVPDARFEEVKEFVRSGVFGPYNYDELMGSLEENEGYGRADYFLVGKDFPSYIECQDKVNEAYQDQKVSPFIDLTLKSLIMILFFPQRFTFTEPQSSCVLFYLVNA